MSSAEETLELNRVFPYKPTEIDEGMKYLGFCLKPNDDHKEDWNWLLEKLEKRLKMWSHK